MAQRKVNTESEKTLFHYILIRDTISRAPVDLRHISNVNKDSLRYQQAMTELKQKPGMFSLPSTEIRPT